MFIDYVPLMLINMVAGLVVLAGFVWQGLSREGRGRWAVAFAMVGFVALVTGLHLIFTWPLPAMYNVTHGELSVLFGTVFLGAALALAAGWDLTMVAVYAFFAGLAAVVIGVRVIHLGLTLKPWPSGIGYILSGLAGMGALPTLYLRGSRVWRGLAVLLLLVTALLWAVTGYGAYWDHLEHFKGWQPATMRTTTAPAR